MGEQRESSLLFSLNQLFEHEKERARRQRLEAEARLAEERALHEENERSIREAELRRAAEEERLKLAEARRKREEEIRIEVLRTAEIERVRAEVDKKIQVEQATLELEHQRKMEAMARDTSLRRQRSLTLTSALLGAAVILGGLGIYFGKLRPEQHRVLLGYEAVLDAKTDQLVEAQRQLTALERERSLLNAELAEVKRTRTSSLPVAEPSQKQMSLRTDRVERTLASPPKGPKMDPHDPMNPTL
jgi:colicin import membrane protein